MTLPTRFQSKFWIRPTLALLGVKPTAVGVDTVPPPAGKERADPERSMRSMRPAIWPLVVSLNLNSLKMNAATLWFELGSQRPALSGLGAVRSWCPACTPTAVVSAAKRKLTGAS